MVLKKYRIDLENLEEDPEYGDVVFVTDLDEAFKKWYNSRIFDLDVIRPDILKFYTGLTGAELKP